MLSSLSDVSYMDVYLFEPAEVVELHVRAGLSRLLEKRYFRPLSVGLSLMLFQQITGQPSVLYYAARIFEKAGFGSAEEATGVSVILG